MAVYKWVNISDDLVYEWVRVFKGLVYEWGRFEILAHTPIQVTPPPHLLHTPSPLLHRKKAEKMESFFEKLKLVLLYYRNPMQNFVMLIDFLKYFLN